MSPQGADHWARLSAFGWYARRLHNVAVQKYMEHSDKEMYNEVQSILESALASLEGISRNGNGGECRPPFCEDTMGNCVPCEENGDEPST